MSKLDVWSKYRMNSGPADVANDVTAHAIKTGYRHVDSATVYRNESPSAAGMLGGGVSRSELFFTSKVPPRSVNYKDAKACVDESLRKTGLDYIDLYLIHAPFGGKSGRLGAWKALTEAVEEGKVKSIGVSNYGVHHLDELEEYIKITEEKEGAGKGGVLSINQVELHPWLARPDIVHWCEKRGVLLEAYSPLVRARRMNDARLVSLSKKHKKTPAQILVRWSLQKVGVTDRTINSQLLTRVTTQGFVPLPKSITHSRIEENANVYDFELDDEDMKQLETSEYAPSAWDPTTSTE
ncbi:MAG: hypothetical protein Q9165_004162 [Trypethelium subeluteriae]